MGFARYIYGMLCDFCFYCNMFVMDFIGVWLNCLRLSYRIFLLSFFSVRLNEVCSFEEFWLPSRRVEGLRDMIFLYVQLYTYMLTSLGR